MLEDLFSHWQKVLPRLLKAATTGIGRFESLTRELTSFFTENPDRVRLVMRESLDHPQDLRKAVGEHVTPWVSLVCDQIRAGQRQKRVDPAVDPEAYVVNVITMVIAGVAISDSMDAVFDDRSNGGEGDGRFVTELLRVARASLFGPSPQKELLGEKPSSIEAVGRDAAGRRTRKGEAR